MLLTPEALQQHEISEQDGQLRYEDGSSIPVLIGPKKIRVGCHTLTRQAWNLLKRLVDGDKE